MSEHVLDFPQVQFWECVDISGILKLQVFLTSPSAISIFSEVASIIQNLCVHKLPPSDFLSSV